MAKKNDGGPAFPRASGAPHESCFTSPSQDGMTLRDYFAAKALQAFLTAPGEVGREARCNSKWGAHWAYEVADAMLAERDRED